VDTIIAPHNNSYNIILHNDAIALQELEVNGRLPQISMQGNALVTKVSGSVLEKAGSATDVLRKVPLLNVGKNNELEVFGRGTPQVYINGRLVRDNRELEQLSSDEISAVEVITNPGVKYSSEVSAVIRIRTIKRKGEGVSALVRIAGSYDKHLNNNDLLNVNYRRGALEVFADCNMSIGKHEFLTENDQIIHYKDNNIRQTAYSDRVLDMRWLSGKLGISYMPATGHSIGAYYNYSSWRKYEDSQTTQYVSNNDIATNTWDITGRDTTDTHPMHNVNVYYIGTIGKLNIDINADYFERTNNDYMWQKEIDNVQNQFHIHINGNNLSKMYAEKLILSYPLYHGSIEFGEEYTNTSVNTGSVNDGVDIADSRIKINETNFATFAEISQSFGKISTNVGLRYEHVSYNYNDIVTENKNQIQRYNNIFPSASINYNERDLRLGLTFTSKCQRPSYSQLDGTLQYSNRTKYIQGNPELKSGKKYNLQLLASWKYIYGQVIYTLAKNAIFQSYKAYDENPCINFVTYNNVPTINVVQGVIGGEYPVGIWTPALTLGIFKQWHKVEYVDGNKKMSSPIGRCELRNTFALKGNWIIDLSCRYTSDGDNDNMHFRSASSMDLGISKSLLNDHLLVRVDGTDLFNKSHSRYSLYNSLGEINCFDGWNKRTISVSLRYKFNSRASNYKGRGAGGDEKSRF
ncbi:MAG: outer membrane beta-barrel family protein, partial [Muribaculaceae bacterium]|nr:outer membrane beta-barrel family protein [Muribaculaceae bacterium]